MLHFSSSFFLVPFLLHFFPISAEGRGVREKEGEVCATCLETESLIIAYTFGTEVSRWFCDLFQVCP